MVYLHKDPEGDSVLKPSAGSGMYHASKGFSTVTTVTTEHHNEVAAVKAED